MTPLTQLTIRPDTDHGLRVHVETEPHASPMVISWGDGSSEQLSKHAEHAYPLPGCYMVIARKGTDAKHGEVIASQQVMVRSGTRVQGVVVAGDHGGIRVHFTSTGDDAAPLPRFVIEWPTGTPEEAWGLPGRELWRHEPPGRYDVRVVDMTTGRATRFPVTALPPKPLVNTQPQPEPPPEPATSPQGNEPEGKPLGNRDPEVTIPEEEGVVTPLRRMCGQLSHDDLSDERHPVDQLHRQPGYDTPAVRHDNYG